MDASKVQIGRLFGVPIVLDASFVLLAVLYGQRYFTSGVLDDVSYGLLLVTGIALSILAHEFGHSFAARAFGVPTSYIELNGMGGLCFHARSLPPNRWINVAVLLAGPAVTALLWLGFEQAGNLAVTSASSLGPVSGLARVSSLLWHLSAVNYVLLIFNLLPSHPLDGGRALAQILSRWIGYDRAMRAVAYLGMLVIAWLLYEGVNGSFFAFVVAFYLYMHNKSALDLHGGPRWTRWN